MELLEKAKEKKENEIKEYSDQIIHIDKLLERYKQSVLVGRIILLISGTFLTLILNIVEQAIFALPGSSPFTVVLPSTLPVVLFSTISMIPLFLGIKESITIGEKIEKEMNINITDLNKDKLYFERLIKYNKKDIDGLSTLIEEREYNLKEKCANYNKVEDNLVYSENQEEKVKTYKLEKQNINSFNRLKK